jgi:hypothetical protein
MSHTQYSTGIFIAKWNDACSGAARKSYVEGVQHESTERNWYKGELAAALTLYPTFHWLKELKGVVCLARATGHLNYIKRVTGSGTNWTGSNGKMKLRSLLVFGTDDYSGGAWLWNYCMLYIARLPGCSALFPL